MIVESLLSYIKGLQEPLFSLTIHFFLALLTYFIGGKVVSVILKLYLNFTNKYRHIVDTDFQGFFYSFIQIGFKVVIFLLSLSVLGVKTDIFIAILGSLGVGVGFALRDIIVSLFNGIIILTYRPFKIDDFIKLNGIDGVVTDINIFSIKLRRFNNEEVFISNQNINNSEIINYTRNKLRRIDITINLYNYQKWAGSSKIESVKEKILDILHSYKYVQQRDRTVIFVDSLDKLSLSFFVGVWVFTDHFYEGQSQLLGLLKESISEGVFISSKLNESSTVLFQKSDL